MHWEYKTLQMTAAGFLGGKIDLQELERQLNALGREGWELVNAFDTNMGSGQTRDVIAIFKRSR